MQRSDVSSNSSVRSSFPTDWDVKPLGEIAEVGSGITLGRTLPTNGTVELPYLRVANVQDGFLDLSEIKQIRILSNEVDRFLLQPGDLLLTEGGDFDKLGRGTVWRGEVSPCLHQNHIFRVRPKQEVVASEFLAAVSGSSYGKSYFLVSSKQTTNLATINSTQLKAFPVPLPPLPEQRKIAKILTTVDNLIEKTEVLIAKYRAIKQGMMHDLFTRGVDEHGHLRPAYDETPELYKESELGWIPMEWEVTSVEEEFEITTGFTLGPHRSPIKNKRKYLRVANVQRDTILLHEVTELEAGQEEFSRRILKVGDLLVVEGHADPNAIGRCALVTPEAEGLTFQNHLFRLRSKGIDHNFSCAWLNGGFSRAYWRCQCGTSSGLNTINQKMLKALPVAVPRLAEQKKISSFLNEHKTRIQSETNFLAKLRSTKTGLMQDLLTGKVRVKIDEPAEAVA